MSLWFLFRRKAREETPSHPDLIRVPITRVDGVTQHYWMHPPDAVEQATSPLDRLLRSLIIITPSPFPIHARFQDDLEIFPDVHDTATTVASSVPPQLAEHLRSKGFRGMVLTSAPLYLVPELENLAAPRQRGGKVHIPVGMYLPVGKVIYAQVDPAEGSEHVEVGNLRRVFHELGHAVGHLVPFEGAESAHDHPEAHYMHEHYYTFLPSRVSSYGLTDLGRREVFAELFAIFSLAEFVKDPTHQQGLQRLFPKAKHFFRRLLKEVGVEFSEE